MTTSFITTAIPYVNARPHLGFAYELVLADALARHRRRRGRDVRFITGTDDHSLKNVAAAAREGLTARVLGRRRRAALAFFTAVPNPRGLGCVGQSDPRCLRQRPCRWPRQSRSALHLARPEDVGRAGTTGWRDARIGSVARARGGTAGSRRCGGRSVSVRRSGRCDRRSDRRRKSQPRDQRAVANRSHRPSRCRRRIVCTARSIANRRVRARAVRSGRCTSDRSETR